MDAIFNVDRRNSALIALSMLQITLMLTANVLIYKLSIINGITMSVGSFIIPFVHVVLDIISERYGFQTAKKIIIISLACQLVFTIACGLLIKLPSPNFWHYQVAYDQVLGKLFRIFVGSLMGSLVGLYVNAKLISKWKILIKGKYFWLRSIGASAIGQLIFSVITITYDMYGIQPAHVIISIISASYTIKLIFTIVASTPAAFIVALLKIYDKTPSYEISINPFMRHKNPNEKIVEA